MVITGVLTKNWEERADDRTQEKSRPRAVSLLHKRSANKTRSGLSLTTWRTPRAGEAVGGGFKLAQPFSGCIWQLLSKLQMHFDSTIPLPGMYLYAYITYTHMRVKK